MKVPRSRKVAAREPKVAIDISGSWARDHIIRVLALDIMDVYPNHTFQPGAIVRRGDLAARPGRGCSTSCSIRPAAGPQPLRHGAHQPLSTTPRSRVVAAGLMDLTPAGAFEPWRPVSGQEAVEVIEGLVRLVGP